MLVKGYSAREDVVSIVVALEVGVNAFTPNLDRCKSGGLAVVIAAGDRSGSRVAVC